MATISQRSLFRWQEIEELGDLERLQLLVENLPDETLMRVLEERRGVAPVSLIDDVLGELDPTRRNALMACLPEQAQIWITTTHLDWLDEHSPAGRLERIRVG